MTPDIPTTFSPRTRPARPWLLPARLAWLGIALLAAGLFLAGLPARYAEIRDRYQGSPQASLFRDERGAMVLGPGWGSAAARAGILDRDILLAIDGTRVDGLSLEQARSALSGGVGTPVRLEVRTGNFPPRLVTVLRDSLEGRILKQFGFSSGFAVGFALAVEALAFLVCLVVAAVIFKNRPDDWMALLASLVLIIVLIGVSLPVVSLRKDDAFSGLDIWFSLAFGTLLLFFYLFPSGQFIPSPTRFLAIILAAWTFIEPFQPDLYPWNQPRWIYLGLIAGWLFTGAVALLVRYRYHSNSEERQKIRWIVWGSIACAAGLLLQILPLAYPLSSTNRIAYDFGLYPLGLAFKLMLPLAIGYAVLRHHFWDIQLVVNRVLVYGLLSALTMSLYLGTVAILGTLLRGLAGQTAFFLATGAVALSFEPLRRRLQRLVNRLMYGDRDEPYQVVTRLAGKLEAAIEPAAALPLTVETIAHALKLPYVAVCLEQDGNGQVAAVYGEPQKQAVRFPLAYAGETIGELIAAPRSGEEKFRPADLHLLTDLARQVGPTAHAYQLFIDLERARLRIVEAREEARRRLGSDLHDGIGHQLAGLKRQSEWAARQLAPGPHPVQETLAAITAQLDRAISQVRRLAHQLYPPELEMLGLAGALRERIQGFGDPSLTIRASFRDDIPRLPTAVESAAYFIVLEALTNVSRHAGASLCDVRLDWKCKNDPLQPSFIDLEICDNGRGLAPVEARGLGLLSMQARAAEVGGTCRVETNPGGGTRIAVRLPCLRVEE